MWTRTGGEAQDWRAKRSSVLADQMRLRALQRRVKRITTMSLRALQRRVAKMEKARAPRPSPIVVMFGSFDNFVAVMFQPAGDNGTMEQGDILDLVEILRGWEINGTWERANAR